MINDKQMRWVEVLREYKLLINNNLKTLTDGLNVIFQVQNMVGIPINLIT